MDVIIGQYKKLVDKDKTVKKSTELMTLTYPYSRKYGLNYSLLLLT